MSNFCNLSNRPPNIYNNIGAHTDRWDSYDIIENNAFLLVDEAIANDANVNDIYDIIFRQKDRIPMPFICNAINLVKRFYREIDSIQITSCEFDDEDINTFDIEIEKRNSNIIVTIYTDYNKELNEMSNMAYLLHNNQLNYGSVTSMINMIKSL